LLVQSVNLFALLRLSLTLNAASPARVTPAKREPESKCHKASRGQAGLKIFRFQLLCNKSVKALPQLFFIPSKEFFP
jgi:hypothetical protein